MCFQIWLGSYLSPMSQLKARNLIKNSNVDFFTSLIREGKFINAVKGLTIFAEKKDVENFSNIFIDDSSKGYTRMIYAKSGKILSDKKDKQFLLFNGKVINIDKARINTFEFDQNTHPSYQNLDQCCTHDFPAFCLNLNYSISLVL